MNEHESHPEATWLAYYWPEIENGQDGYFAIRVSWSVPLTQLSIEQEKRLRRLLLGAVNQASTESLAEAFGTDRPDVAVFLDTFGTHAEALDVAMVVFRDLPKEFLQEVLIDGVKMGMGAFIPALYRRMRAIRIEADGHDLEPVLSFSPPAIVEACRAHFSRYMNEDVNSARWSVVSREDGGRWAYQSVVDVTIESDHVTGVYRVDDTGYVLRFETNGRIQERPNLFDFYLAEQDPTSLDGKLLWPSQDGIDRSEHLAIIVRLHFTPDFPYDSDEVSDQAFEAGTELIEQSAETLQASVRRMLPEASHLHVDVQPYQVGAAVGGMVDIAHHVVTLYESRDAILLGLDHGLNVYELARILIDTHHALRNWIHERAIPGLDIQVAYTAGDLKLLCQKYVRDNYHRKAKLKSEVFCLSQEFYGGIQSPAHPTEAIEYLVLVRTKKRTYKFRVWGDGEVTEHTVTRNGRELPLELPDLFSGDEGIGN